MCVQSFAFNQFLLKSCADNYIDGNEFLELTESEIKDIVPPIGIAKKVIRLQPKVCLHFSSSVPNLVYVNLDYLYECLLQPFPDFSEPVLSPTPSVTSVMESSITSLSSTDKGEHASPKSPDVEPIEIPSKWRDDTLACISEKKLTPSARKEIVQTLVTLVISKFGSNPTKAQLEIVARRLILKYPFMRDDIGTGYVSHMHAGMPFWYC